MASTTSADSSFLRGFNEGAAQVKLTGELQRDAAFHVLPAAPRVSEASSGTLPVPTENPVTAGR